MRMRGAITLGFALLAGALVGGLVGGGFLHTLFAQLLCMWLLPPLLITLVVCIGDRLRKGHRSDLLSGFALGLTAIVLCILGFASAGPAVFYLRESEVRSFVEDTLPKLDAHKKQFGQYPTNLAEVTKVSLPYHLRGRGRYTSDGTSFTFYYENADSIMSGLMLTDTHRRWSRAD